MSMQTILTALLSGGACGGLSMELTRIIGYLANWQNAKRKESARIAGSFAGIGGLILFSDSLFSDYAMTLQDRAQFVLFVALVPACLVSIFAILNPIEAPVPLPDVPGESDLDKLESELNKIPGMSRLVDKELARRRRWSSPL